MRLILSIALSLFLIGCFSQSMEKVGTEVVDLLNKRDYSKLWDKYIDDGTKVEFEIAIDDARTSPMLGSLMMSMIGIPEDKINTITPKEYFISLMEFSMNLSNLKPDTEELVLVYKDIKVIDKNNTVILLEGSSMFNNKLYLIKIDGKWYLNMNDK